MVLLQYSWASRVAQLVKNPLATQETWVGKIPWRRERLPTPVFCPGEFHGLYSPWGRKQTPLSDFHFQSVVPFHHNLRVLLLVMIGLSPVRRILKNAGVNILWIWICVLVHMCKMTLMQGFSKWGLFISNIIIWEFIRNAIFLVTSQTLLRWKLWKRGLAMGCN